MVTLVGSYNNESKTRKLQSVISYIVITSIDLRILFCSVRKSNNPEEIQQSLELCNTTDKETKAVMQLPTETTVMNSEDVCQMTVSSKLILKLSST